MTTPLAMPVELSDVSSGDESPRMKVKQAVRVHAPPLHPFGMPDTLGDAPPSPTSFQKVVWQIESLQQRLVEVHVQELESLHQDLRTLRGDTDSLHGACASTTPVSSR
eukprot:CAMPEP_0115104092 /NCGR_PEP_ID=MMETSP0227-20121206/35059_1 /TAXON_ID=89957 /ORGANISM="Polarella glacialis, Strain CCMP 1383" /LENGTH=107 /DNA_ID=CAMNT_0002500843 /DNA_START=25 /DNA_END=344 /DNA_ORIENTATION=-